MKIKFLGAAGTVTGSSYVLTSDAGNSILIDLGMFQGLPEIEKLNYLPFDYNCAQLDGAILTHAHLDHCGRLPILLPKGFKGKIHMTGPTRDLTEISLLDSAKIAIQDNKKILYDRDLAYKTIDRFVVQNYREDFPVGDFKVRMRDAGHILGSTFLEIEDMRCSSEIRKIIFSGDLGNYPEDLVKTTEFADEADAVVMESTYGDRLHPEEDSSKMLQDEINAVESSGGTLLIPTFALERTQELLHLIMHLKKDGKVRAETPIILDSPMADKATEVYMDYPELFNVHIEEDLASGGMFNFEGLEVIIKRSQSRALYKRNEAKVILAGSGMMAGGRIVGHAAQYLSKKENRLFIVGYQGEGTLGRELMEGKKEVVIEGKNIVVKSSVTATHAMSSHADQQQLLDWFTHIKGVKKLFLTHGEDASRLAFSKRVTEECGLHDIHLPILNQTIDCEL